MRTSLQYINLLLYINYYTWIAIYKYLLPYLEEELGGSTDDFTM